MKPILFPAPKNATFSPKKNSLDDAFWIIIDPAASMNLRSRIAQWMDTVSNLLRANLEITCGNPGAGDILVEIKCNQKNIPAQGYSLIHSADGIELCASDEAGIFYGLTTLTQIFDACKKTVPEFVITDEPDFANRGIMLDISRCKVPTMDTLYSLIDLFASLKINQLQLYMEQTYAFSEHQVVWDKSSPYGAQEILAIDAYCKARYIELVPNFNSFGHFERWLQHPEFAHLADSIDGMTMWGNFYSGGSTLRPTRESIDFIDSLYREFLPNFTSGHFNAGCDETDLGKGKSKKLAEKIGTTNVYLEHLKKIHALIGRHDKKMMFWGDIILNKPELIAQLPKPIIALNWGYEATHPFATETAAFAKAKIPFYVCPGTSSWSTLTGRTDNCFDNLKSAAISGLKNGAIGYLNTDWGDGGHHQYLPISYPAYFAGASLSWNTKGHSNAALVRALDHVMFSDCKMADFLVELGNVYLTTPIRPKNKTVFNELLFWDFKKKTEPPFFKDITVEMLNKYLSAFTLLDKKLSKITLKGSDGVLIKTEIKNAIDLAIHGIHRGLKALGAGPGVAVLKKELRDCIAVHEKVWRARNRFGGLKESSDRLKRSLKALTDN